MAQPQASSPLLSLPAELRLHIYNYVVTTDDGYFVLVDKDFHFHSSYGPRESLPDNMHEHITHLQAQQAARHFSLIYTCRQIHAEARLLPFRSNTLVFNSHRFFRVIQNGVTKLQWRSITAVKLLLGLSLFRMTPMLGNIVIYKTRVLDVLASLPGLKRLEIEIGVQGQVGMRPGLETDYFLICLASNLREWVKRLTGNGVACTLWAFTEGPMGTDIKEL